MTLSNELRNRFLQFYQIAITNASISLSEREMIQRVADRVGITQKDLTAFMWEVQPDEINIPSPVPDKIDWLYDLALMVGTNEEANRDEKDMLHLFCSVFGFKDENLSKVCDFLLNNVKENAAKADVINTVKKRL